VGEEGAEGGGKEERRGKDQHDGREGGREKEEEAEAEAEAAQPHSRFWGPPEREK
jgi:hypothetical protein